MPAVPGPSAIHVISSGVVYRNPKPYLRSRHTWHPSLAIGKTGEWTVAFDLGEAVESLDYRTHVCRSDDEGASWTEPLPLVGPYPNRLTSNLVRIRGLADGTIVGLGAFLFRDEAEEGFVSRKTFGYVPMELFTIRSVDGGRNWTPPASFQPPLVGPSFEICHAILELADGRWLAPMGTWKGWNGEAPNGMKAVALVSHDRGRTWPEYIDILDDYARGVIHFEQSVVQLKDGRLLAVAWAFREKEGTTDPTPYVISADGRTFSKPRLTGLNGQTAKLGCLPDGRVLCLYRRNDKPGLWANVSRMDGDEWINQAEAPIWQGAGSGMTGQENAGEELSRLKFGFPSMAVLPNGEVLAVFWCCEESIHQIRWVRLSINADRPSAAT